MARRKKRGLKGAGQVRWLLRRMPDAVQAEIVDLYRQAEAPALAAARAGVPVRTGALRSAMRTQILTRSLIFRVGLIGKKANSRFFYGWILEVGRKAKVVRVNRGARTYESVRVIARADGRATGTRRVSAAAQRYALRVSAIPATRYDMVKGRAKAQIRQLIVDPLRTIWDKALRRAALGAGDD